MNPDLGDGAMPERLLRVAQCSVDGSTGVWEFVLTDSRCIMVHRGEVKTPSLWWGLAGGAGGAAIGWLLTRQAIGDSVDEGVNFDALAANAGNLMVPHDSVRRAWLERGFGVWKSLTLEYGEPGRGGRLKTLVAAPEAYVQARRPAGLGRLAAQREFTQGFRSDLWRLLRAGVVVKDKWK